MEAAQDVRISNVLFFFDQHGQMAFFENCSDSVYGIDTPFEIRDDPLWEEFSSFALTEMHFDRRAARLTIRADYEPYSARSELYPGKMTIRQIESFEPTETRLFDLRAFQNQD
ncbi:hypothetical protein [Aurantiacibacter sediminis]|uniref:Uncharacterized protein n=1 Tax=Aurantiacibacter sediminis TaxID=2793064 RepID=A0ABS0N145_9SPHN|nr:hypothetical protein [Aurantiacibacter sediminis]MBH5321684.1 hypothetical protein [Aurantiacibacter sediminis]